MSELDGKPVSGPRRDLFDREFVLSGECRDGAGHRTDYKKILEERVLVAAEKRALGSELMDAASLSALDFAVPSTIHPDDFIFWYIYDYGELENKVDAPYLYLQSGKDIAVFVSKLLEEQGVRIALDRRPDPAKRVSLLEFASGYGRVTRHFPIHTPDVDVVACDIHDDAIRFLRSLGWQAVRSSSVPEHLDTGRLFNVVFAFSFFTHMPRSTWGRWLRALVRQLEPNGLLIFTAHGEISQPLMEVDTLEPDGFYFRSESEQNDIDGADYGNTVTAFEFVNREVMKSGFKLIYFSQAGIVHHDVYVIRNDPDAIVYDDPDIASLSLENRALRTEI